MKNIKYFNSNGVRLAVSNLIYRGPSIVDIEDAVEESRTAQELVNRLNSLDLLRKFEPDKETDTYVRLKSVDKLGNVHYFQVEKDPVLTEADVVFIGTLSNNTVDELLDVLEAFRGKKVSIKRCNSISIYQDGNIMILEGKDE